MSPETTAKAICEKLALDEARFDERDWVGMPRHNRERYVERCMLAAPLIATAIREAEDAEREECADIADHALHGVSLASVEPSFAEGMLEGIALAALLIRGGAIPETSRNLKKGT